MDAAIATATDKAFATARATHRAAATATAIDAVRAAAKVTVTLIEIMFPISLSLFF
jgi:hypothetical protein